MANNKPRIHLPDLLLMIFILVMIYILIALIRKEPFVTNKTSASKESKDQQSFVTLIGDCVDSKCKSIQLPIGSYKSSQLEANGMDIYANKVQISRISVPPGLSVRVYEDDNFEGRNVEFKGNDDDSQVVKLEYDLSTISMPKPKNKDDIWLNNVESLEVKHR